MKLDLLRYMNSGININKKSCQITLTAFQFFNYKNYLEASTIVIAAC